jgi:hypothetical protein
MFADACQKAMSFTRPVAISTRLYDGTLNTDIGSMIVINEEGWIITAGHVFDSFVKFQKDMKKMEEINEINASRVQNPNAPSSEIKMDKSMITNHSFWWGWDGVRINNVYVNREVDIAVGKLEPFNPAWVKDYPVFIDPDHMRIGTSVCRGGYPFINIKPEFMEDKKAFRIPGIPNQKFFYPLEGIYSHYEEKGRSIDGTCNKNYIETSSIGLKGQSGGPIFDKDCRIYGMQVLTDHRPLGFHPTVELDGQKYIENQFINVGVGIHVSTIFEVLDSRHIRYQKEGDESGFRIVG